VCEWDYTGQGIEYQLIAGPVFIVVYTLCGIFIGVLSLYACGHTILHFM